MEPFTFVPIIILNYLIFLFLLLSDLQVSIFYFIYPTILDSFGDYNHFSSITTSLMKDAIAYSFPNCSEYICNVSYWKTDLSGKCSQNLQIWEWPYLAFGKKNKPLAGDIIFDSISSREGWSYG